MKSFISIFFHVCPLLLLFYPLVVTPISPPKTMNYTFPAVIAFGDSILDTGNNDYIITYMKANFKPYGRDFIGAKSTGRFSNGKIPSDFFVETLGIKGTLPPYLDPKLKVDDLLTGVCFASAGSGYDPVTARIILALSADDQLQMFKEYIEKLKAAVGEERTNFILAKSIFIISMGSNDISITYFMTPIRRHKYDIAEYTSMLVNTSSDFVKELYQLGARRIGVIGLTPVGCVPFQRTVRGGIGRNCVESVNQAAMLYNSKLSSAIMALNTDFTDARLVYIEAYEELNEIIQHHNQFGFEVEDSACCGIGNVELGPLCNPLNLKVCEDASKYVFWDSYHPTERAYNILVSEIIKKNIDKFVS
ncbi:GDSL esterase/lipase At1g20120-like [Abrus precatorius]|uniref:GDSL esterase/lipase At1g20120-like n=1 Tax=Abrus precatorius TaxID=3816 RepID=A0A8B8KDP0_ABRPR|nr:GDSL esterase/lipase At1g20120-like [Abrus precatorius]